MESKYKGATCRGCYALGTACGTCEKCKDELARMQYVQQELPLCKACDGTGIIKSGDPGDCDPSQLERPCDVCNIVEPIPMWTSNTLKNYHTLAIGQGATRATEALTSVHPGISNIDKTILHKYFDWVREAAGLAEHLNNKYCVDCKGEDNEPEGVI